MSDGDPAEDVGHYGPLRRVLLVVLGGAMALLGASASILLTVLFATGVAGGEFRTARGLLGGIVFIAVIFLFGAFGAMGAMRLMNGVRGRPGGRIAAALRAESGYGRNWYVAGLIAWGVMSGIILLGSHDRTELLVSRTVSAERMPWLVFLSFAILPLHVAAHELGHAAAAALVGFRFVETRVGWFALRREEGRVRASWTTPSIPGVLGFHSAVPQGNAALARRWAIIAAAGPAVSLTMALTCHAAALAVSRSTVGSAILSDLLSVSSWVAAALAAMTLVPLRLGAGVLSDGAVVALAFLPGAAVRDAELVFLSRWAQGRRPRDWGLPSETFLRAADAATVGRERLLLAALCVALDTGDEARANEVLQRVGAGIPSRDATMRYELELQIAMVEAFRGQPARARGRLERAGADAHCPRYSWLAEAVVQVTEGRVSEASETLLGWERAIAESGREASVRVGNEWALERLRERLTPR